MNSRERALKSLDFEEPDRVPLDYWAVPEATLSLVRETGLRSREELMELFGIDFRYVFPAYSGPALKNTPCWNEDIWGIRRDRVYNEVVLAPLASAETPDDLASCRWPDPGWYDCSGFLQARRDKRCTVLCDDRTNRTSVLHQGIYLRGMENMMADLILNPSLAHDLFERITAFYLELNRKIFEAARGRIDIILIGDDFGTQEGLLVSRQMLREFVYPHLKKHFDMAHEFGIKVMFHSCGAVREIIPDLLELGVDILNPLQVTARGMDAAEIKKEFGAFLCLHGGVDTQRLLPFGDEEEVRKEVRRIIKTLSPGGGFILSPTHNLQKNIPPRNIVALYEEALSSGRGGA